MKVRLNLATAPLENNRPFLFASAALGTVAAGALVLLSLHAYEGWRESRDNRSKVAALEREMRELRNERRDLEEYFKLSETRRIMERAAFLNSLIERRSFPWTGIFMDLERRLPEGVRVVNISPRMHEGRVELRLVVGARSDEGKLEFLKTLEGAKEFSSVQVVSERRQERADDPDKILLELVAWYSSLGP